MFLLACFAIMHAAASYLAAANPSTTLHPSSQPVVRISMPPRDQPSRISLPSDLFIGATVISNAPASTSSVAGAIDLPSNVRAGSEPQVVVIDDEDTPSRDDTVIYGAYAVRRYGYPVYGLHRSHRRVAGSVPADPSQPESIFDTTADDIHRRAQLSFSSASYPNLGTFEDAHRRAQLQFYRSTLTPGAARSPDLLRHDRTNLRGPDLRRDSTTGRRW